MQATRNEGSLRVSGLTYTPEVPSFEPVHDAAFYITCAGGAHAPLGAKHANEVEVLISFHRQWGKDSPYRVKGEMPSEFPNWRHEILTLTPEEFGPFHTDVTIRDDRIEWLPDIFRGSHWTVSERFKSVIEEIDPGWHYFFPVRILSESTKQTLRNDYFCWVPRRRFTYWPLEEHGPDAEIYPNLMNPALRADSLYVLTTDEPTREFFRSIPVWGVGLSLDHVVYSAATFRQLKSSGCTGLVEHLDGAETLENPMATIGCVY